VQFACSQVFKVFCGRDEAVDFRVVHQAGGQGAELVDVLLAGERTGTQWVRVGYGDLHGDHGAVVRGDLNRAAEGLLRDIQRVVAAGPLRIFFGGDLVPQLNGVGTAGTFWSVGIHVVPCAILQGHGEDVRNRVIQGFARCGRIVLLRVVRTGADDVVGVVRSLDQHRLHVLRVGGFWVLAMQLAGQV